jgi:hypothetical protein
MGRSEKVELWQRTKAGEVQQGRNFGFRAVRIALACPAPLGGTMSTSNWVVILTVFALGLGTAVLTDKGSYLNALVTGQCNACPAPRQCSGSAGSGIGRGYLPPINGCGTPWWKRNRWSS